MFTNKQMKKTNLKAKKQNTPNKNQTTNQSKQMTLHNFFVGKTSSNKENLEDASNSTNGNAPSFECHADIHSQESPKKLNSARVDSPKSDNIKKALETNSENTNSRNFSGTNKRKSSESQDLKEEDETEALQKNSLKTEGDGITYPLHKKVNLNGSTVKISNKKCSEEFGLSETEYCVVDSEKQCMKSSRKVSKVEEIAVSKITLEKPKTLTKNQKCKNKSEKRKLSESSDPIEDFVNNYLLNNLETESNKITPRSKKDNSKNSTENNVSNKKCFEELNPLKTEHCVVDSKKQSVKSLCKVSQSKAVGVDGSIFKKLKTPTHPKEKCKNEPISSTKSTSNNIHQTTSEVSVKSISKSTEENPSVKKRNKSLKLQSLMRTVALDVNQSGEAMAASLKTEETVRSEVEDDVSELNASLERHFSEDLLSEDWDLNIEETSRNLSLDTMKRCKVTDVKIIKHDKLITLRSFEDKSAFCTCKLRGIWLHLIIATNDIVNIIAEFKNNEWVVDNNGGLLVLHPDTLVSSTSLMGSMFCRRKAVIANSFQIKDVGAKCMVIGSLAHSLLQNVMQNNIRCEEKIQTIIDDIVFDPSLVHSLLLSQMDFEEIKEELNGYVPEVIKFMETYVTPTTSSNMRSGWNGEITCIKDIEENIWSPTYGVKGKVDVTVEVNVDGVKKIMPFELKTGKSSNSAEHRGQVILYILMMTQLNYDVKSGLLLYLKDGTMKEVPIDHHVKRDIIMMRNDFVHFIASSQISEFSEDGSIKAPRLPEPINHHSACGRCSYQTFCCAALVDDNMAGVDRGNLINSLSESTLDHLKLPHIRYVFNWIGLLRLEEAEKKSRKNTDIKDLWCKSAKEREESGVCVANLSLVKVDPKNNSFLHILKFPNRTLANFSVGECVILSSNTQIAVAMGIILNITDDNLSICLEKDLGMRGEKVFHVDHYESQTLNVFNLSNLSSLLENSVRVNRLREEIIDLKLPSFSQVSPKVPDDIMRKLNDRQKQAVLKAFAADSYLLIQGMPGCGKTETLAALVKLLAENGLSVLITSHTHSAVDNLVLRLRGSVDFLRLGSKNKIHPALREYCDEVQLAKLEFKSLADVKNFYLSKMIVAVTVLGCSHPVLSLRKFDVCIVDEATQILQPSVLRPLMAASKYVLVGDPMQLPPLVYSNVARSQGLSESLFIRLNRPSATVVLNMQYRMNTQITALANFFMYNGALKCADENVANNILSIDNLKVDTVQRFPWLELVLSRKIEHSVVFVDVKETNVNVKNEICVNHAEAKAVMVVLEALITAGVKHDSVGVIAFYRAQVNLIHQQTVERNFNIEVNTVDTYQGKDKEIILISCTAQTAGKEGILNSNERLSVAITRAKQKLVFFGDTTVLRSYKPFEKILQYISVDCITKA